jgi:hypothetical protein
MLRATMTIRTLLLLAGIGATVGAAKPAAAQSPCIPGYYYNPVYGCLVTGELPYILPRHVYTHPYYPSPGFSPHSHMAAGGYVPEPGLSPQHIYVRPSASGLSMGHSGPGGDSFGHSSFGGGGFGGGGFGGGGFGGGFGGGGHGR